MIGTEKILFDKIKEELKEKEYGFQNDYFSCSKWTKKLNQL